MDAVTAAVETTATPAAAPVEAAAPAAPASEFGDLSGLFQSVVAEPGMVPPDAQPAPDAPKPVEAQPAPTPVPDKTARLLEAARAEREARKAAREAKAQADGVQPLLSAKALAKQDPIAALAAMGLTPEDVINHVIEGISTVKAPTPEEVARKVAQEEAAKVEARIGDAARGRIVEEQKQLVSSHLHEIEQTAKAAPDKYAAINGHGLHKQVQDYVATVAQRENRLVSVTEALDHVESQVRAEVRSMAEMLGLLPKQPPAGAQTAATVPTQGPPTLTNRGASEVSALQRQTEPQTDEERLARAAAFLKFT